MSKTYVDVAPFVPLQTSSHSTYTYQLPDSSPPSLYSPVRIPWQKRSLLGLVMGLHHTTPAYPTKVCQPLAPWALHPAQVEFARWIATHMQGSLGFTLRLFLPPGSLQESSPRPLSASPISRRRLSKATTQLLSQLTAGNAAYIDTNEATRGTRLHELAQDKLADGKQVLVVVAEVWRAEHIYDTLPARLKASASLIHGNLPAKELRTLWHALAAGQPRLIIGTQKSLFFPYATLGLITLDEEFLSTHKLWDQYPHLHNYYATAALAAIHHSPLLYLTSLPSLRLHHLITTKKVLASGQLPATIPAVTIITPSWTDRRHQAVLSREVVDLIKKSRLKYTLVFTTHDTKPLKHFLKKVLPRTREVIRLDAHTRQALPATPTVIIATPALFTAHPHLTCDQVIWLYPEHPFQYPDWRSEEETYYLLWRLRQYVSASGQIYCVTKKKRLLEDRLLLPPEAFYAQQLTDRRRVGYPPYTDVVLLTVSGKNQTRSAARAKKIRQQLDERCVAHPTTKVLGPFQPLVSPTRSEHRFHLLVRGPLATLPSLLKDLACDRVDLEPESVV